MIWDCCPSAASSDKKLWRASVAVDVQEMVVLQMLSWEKRCLVSGEDGEVPECWKMLKPYFSEASTLPFVNYHLVIVAYLLLRTVSAHHCL